MENHCRFRFKKLCGSVNITERLIKFGTYFLFTAIILLIVVSFGMPDFFGASQAAQKGIVAEVNGEAVTKRDVNRNLDAIKKQFSQFNGAATGLEGFLESQAVERSINGKLISSLAEKTGFKPTESSSALVLARIYPQRYPELIKDGRFDFKELQKMLRRNGQSRTQLEKLILEAVMNSQFQTIIQSVSPENKINESVNQSIESYSLKAQILYLSLDDFNKSIKKSAKFTDEEINIIFEKEYKKDSQPSTLTETTKSAIQEGLFQKRKSTLINDLLAKSDYSLQKIQTQLKGKTTSFTAKDIFSEKGPEDFKELAELKKINGFINQLGTLELNKVGTPIEHNGKVYLVSINERNITKADPTNEDSAKRKSLAISQMNAAFNTLFRVSREQAVIVRFDKKSF
jgi:hypothetical protein